MGSRSRSRGRAHPARDRGLESEDTEISTLGDRSSFRFRTSGERAEPLGEHLRARNTGWGSFTLVVDRVASTNDLAREIAKHGAPHGSLVVAETQSGGRGRWKRRWASDRGGLYMSLLLRPIRDTERARVNLLPLLASIAAAEALEAVSGLTFRLRWPNDLFRDAKKLGGVLCESSFSGSSLEYAVVGFGINVNQTEDSFPAEIAPSATSLRCLLERSFDRLEVAAHLVSRTERWWHELETDAALDRFRELAEGLEGYPIEVRGSDDSSFVAKSLGISRDGGLRVELPDGTERTLYSDDVLLMRPREENYYAAVENYFIERRGSPLFITPSEWQLVWKWEQLGIPLEVVKEGIDRVFERPKTRQKPRKLGYCRQTVEAAYRRFREAALGVHEAALEESSDARDHLEELAEKLRQAHTLWRARDENVAEAIASCERQVETCAVQLTSHSIAEVEESLTAEEERLLDVLEAALGEQRRRELVQESEASLAEYRHRMPEKVHASAVKSAYRRRLRLELGIPTLSLLDR